MPRPRYSLLALLLFTALVAGGVKLWRGPHHVVDRSNPQMEDEYTYYRAWDGTKIVDGVRVRRYLLTKGMNTNLVWTIKWLNDPRAERVAKHPATATIMFDYYCRGEKLSLRQTLVSIPREFADQNIKEPAMSFMYSDVYQVPERAEFDAAIEREKQKLLDLGGYVWEMYGLPEREN